MIGKTLSHYRIVEKIGAGGMGEVYRARDERLERDVAVKVLPTGTLADEAARKRFRKEALALSKLNHPHIATVFDFDTQDGLDFLVMEYVPGPSLAETLGDGALSEKEVVRLGGQIASALEEAHGQRVVHRDLKPGNIALTARGDAKVLDFGLAKLVRPVSQATTLDSLSETQGMAGTLPYMAPEQLRGEEVDARTDIHALGAILYEMVTGRRPFPETHGPRLTDAILHQAPPPPGRLKPNLSTRLEEIILKCLEKEPEHRYQSAKELLVDLRRPATPTGVSPRQVPGGSARLRLMVRLGAVGIAVGALLVALVGLNVGGLRDRLTGSVRSGQITSLAVLPLDNLMNDPEQDYFVDGMTEAVITELSKIGALKVISRTSVMRYKETDKSLRAIAADLGVDAIVEGSVLRSGDRVRITAQLIDASTDEHLWADNFDRSLGDILALHSDVAQAIAREIKIAVTPEEEAHLASARPVNPEAHEAYLKGDYHWNKFTREGFAQSLGYFQQAIEIDPDYAPAYAGMARAYSVLGVFGGLVPSETHPKAKTAALKALELDDTLAQAHVALGMTMLLYDWDWAGAERELKRAIELNPSSMHTRYAHAIYLARMGRLQEALAEMKQARELDPLSLRTNGGLAWILYLGRHYDQAIEQSRNTLEMDPNFPMAHWVLGLAYEQKGRLDEAIAELQQAVTLSPGTPILEAWLAYTYAVAGKEDEARKLLAELNNPPKPMYVPPTVLAVIYVGLGEKEQAFALLEKAYERHDGELVWLRIFPQFDPLRSDSRFQALLRRMNFPE